MSEKERGRDKAVIFMNMLFLKPRAIGPLNNEMQNLIDWPFGTSKVSAANFADLQYSLEDSAISPDSLIRHGTE